MGEAIHAGVEVEACEEGSTPVCLRALLHEAHTHMDQCDRVGAEGQIGNGNCGNRCSQGSLGEKGKWQHRYALGVASQRAKGGVGRKEMKQAIPHLLHLEILEAAE